MPLNSTRAFENEHDRLLEKLQQLREAAKPFVALQHYFEHGHTGGRATICAGSRRPRSEYATRT